MPSEKKRNILWQSVNFSCYPLYCLSTFVIKYSIFTASLILYNKFIFTYNCQVCLKFLLINFYWPMCLYFCGSKEKIKGFSVVKFVSFDTLWRSSHNWVNVICLRSWLLAKFNIDCWPKNIILPSWTVMAKSLFLSIYFFKSS